MSRPTMPPTEPTPADKPLANVCMLRLSALGDVCHAAAVAERITRHWPQTRLTWVIGKLERQLVGDIPGVEFVEFDKSGGFAAWRALRKRLRSQQFDALLHMQVAARASLVSTAIRARRRIGFDRARAREGQWLFSNERIAAQPSAHVLEGFMAFADVLGVPRDDKPRWSIPIPVAARDWAAEQLDDAAFPVVVVPSASKPERNWSVEGYAAVIDYLESRGARVFLCGGPSQPEADFAARVAHYATSDVVNLVGQTDLKQLLAVLRGARLLIAPDTGPVHMAVTQGTPVIGLYAHSNPQRTGPYLYRNYAVSVYDQIVAEQHGRAPDQLRWGTRAKGDDLMSRIEVEAVTSAIDRAISDFALPARAPVG